MINLNGETYFTYKEIANILGYREDYVRSLVKQKKLTSLRMTKGQTRHIALTTLKGYINNTSLSPVAKEALDYKIFAMLNKPVEVDDDTASIVMRSIDTMANNAQSLENMTEEQKRQVTIDNLIDAVFKDIPLKQDAKHIIMQSVRQQLEALQSLKPDDIIDQTLLPQSNDTTPTE
jgi:excisionase family DNA binding protein